MKKLQRIVSIILLVVTIVSISPALVLLANATQSRYQNFSKNFETTGDGATDIVNVALAQAGKNGSQLGYTEEWCANFVGDCAKLAGQGAAIAPCGSVRSMYGELLENGAKVIHSGYQPGDICFIDWGGNGGFRHVEIVYNVSGGAVYTIGGNSGDGSSLYSRYVKKHAPIESKCITAILRPAYVSTGYLSKCTFYPSNGKITVNSTTAFRSLPCSKATDKKSTAVYTPEKDSKWTVTGIYKNTTDDYWYETKYDGETCYVHSEDVTFSSSGYGSVALSGVIAPAHLKTGSSFSIKGKISSTKLKLSKVSVYVYKGKSATGETVLSGADTTGLGTDYQLYNSDIDSGLKFGKLTAGTYTYKVVASVKNYHANGNTLTRIGTKSFDLHLSNFTISSSGGSSNCAQGDHGWKRATCTTPKTCKTCGEISGSAPGHSYVSGKCTRCGHAPAGVKITKQPASVKTLQGSAITVNLTVTGDGLTYKWYYKDQGSKNFTRTSTFKGNSYNTTMTSARNGRQLYCVVTDKYGNSVKSRTVTLSLAEKVKITTQPKNAYATLNKYAEISVLAEGEGLTYRWFVRSANGTKYYPSTQSTNKYKMKITSATAGRKAYCIITDKFGNSVQTKTVELREQLTITEQPRSVAVAPGKIAQATVNATGEGLIYRWYYKNAGSKKYTYTSTFTGNSYHVTMNNARNGRIVLCRVYDKYGNMVQSNSVKLSMKATK